MKLIIGYFVAIGLLLTSLSIFANQKADAETGAEEPASKATIQATSSDTNMEDETEITGRTFVI
ncbi:hypothetical protein [Henriciella litoralis]|uniref:hypothetical protein n=1 Tax=Henriciella litoralis TaxID=568102 RepID=UPI0009FC1713|nr:hypothetical protein [Henriciella litoralis]